ncbi:MAG: AAA family ATPase [Candidatus Parvarchaeota archaeon]|nr:AAA family ATPase [Candidatus Jingweiarchaeum tengchongense]MCW1298546.1 AAA family ATPase [Candidatus Jingweiarchaeum tengchongense]MCW1300208.1 AAA family ATPase [Candidatus Jingweiarchaeum tengchongense]MCW1304558.1 AAA family ATPase [Candidatus Jingweiarchaeum tengchongense]MCW1305714.1 AAA family ATPase [Candidatus Jingweiarchaeum tengchongense]
MRLIAITGMPAAGKTEVVKILEAMGFPVVVMRDVVEREMEEKGIEVNNENLRNYATELREKYGFDVVARRCKPFIDEKLKMSEIVVIDGVRGIKEVEYFKEVYDENFVLIAIHASPKTRFERIRKRGLKWDMETWEEFIWRDKKELSWGLGEAIALSDYMIVNEDTLEELREKVNAVINEIIKR